MVRKLALAVGVGVSILGLATFAVVFGSENIFADRGAIFGANGRLEMERVDLAVKYPGRVTEVTFQEGDDVEPGATLVKMDDADLRAQLEGAKAVKLRAESALARAQAEYDARKGRQRLSQVEMKEASAMRSKALVSQMEFDRRQVAAEAEEAALKAAGAAVAEAHAAIAEASAAIARLQVALQDAIVTAPVAGRIEYRLVQPGSVLPAGGRVASVLDQNNVFMSVFLPSHVAGKLKINDDARVLLDVFPDKPLPAKVTFVAAEAQFTPKYVETANQRENLVYRVKLRIPAEVAKREAGVLKAGMTGTGYVRTDQNAPWSAKLRVPSLQANAQ